MTTKLQKILNRPRWIRQDIKDLESELRAYRETMILPGIGYDQERVQTSPKDRMPDYAARAEKLLSRIKDKERDYLRAHGKVVRMTRKLDPIERSIIIQRYIEGRSYEAIAESFPMSERQMFNYRRSAIEKLEKIAVNCSKDR